jgi:hypothetical protein
MNLNYEINQINQLHLRYQRKQMNRLSHLFLKNH